MVRPVAETDVAAVVDMVHELAEYERASHECHLTVDALRLALFGDRPALFGHVVELPGGPELVGMALWFLNFSTWDGVHGIYIEDLYVRPEHRGGGFGRALLVELATECVRRGYTRLQWSVLDWNEPSVQFYRGLGARPFEEWVGYRLTGDALRELAAQRVG